MFGSLLRLGAALALGLGPGPDSNPGPGPAGAPRALDPRLAFELVAKEPALVTPTGLAVDSKGRLLVIESHTHFRPREYSGPPADRIRLFEDPDGDGRFDRISTFFEGTRMTMNLAFDRAGALFVATRSALYRLEDRDGDGRADGEAARGVPTPIVRLDTPGDYPHNGLSGFAFDRAGLVYFGLGENLGAEYRLIGSDGTTFSGGGEGGNIYRCHPDGSKLERIATGFWNPFHVAFDAFGQLFAVDNDPDSRPPCRLLHIVEGGDYGYRFRNGRKGLHPFTAWNGELPGTLPMVAGTGEAPCAVLPYEADHLPAEYRGTLLVTSWGDHRIERYRLQPRGASFRAAMEPVVVGGEDFRPVGMAMAPDGSLYFSDWVDKAYELHGKGRLWRLRTLSPRPAAGQTGKRPTTSPPANLPLLNEADALRHASGLSAQAALLKALDSDDPFLNQAAREGLRRVLSRAELERLAQDPSAPRRLAAALVLRATGRPAGQALLGRLLDDPDPAVRFVAIQWVGEDRRAEFRPRLVQALSSATSTRQEFEAALAALELLEARKGSPQDEASGQDHVAAIVTDPGASATAVRRALRMLRPDHPALTLERFQRLLSAPDEALRLEAVRSLAGSALPRRFELLSKLADDRRQADPLRAWAALGLADDSPAQRMRLVALAEHAPAPVRREALRSMRGLHLSDAERTGLASASAGDEESRRLLESIEPAAPISGASSSAPRPARVDLDAWLKRLEGPADAAAGERLFFHPRGPGCARCHQVEGRGGAIGPDLSRLTRGMDRRRLVQSLLQPSAEVAPQFVAWSVARTDGTVFTGVLVSESADGHWTFADSEGRLITLGAAEIEDRKPQNVSIMPDNVASGLTTQEFRDLVAFLLSRQ